MKSIINAIYSERVMIMAIIGGSVITAVLLSLLTIKYRFNKGKTSIFTLLYPLKTTHLIALSASLSKLVLIVVGTILANRITFGNLFGFYLSDLMVLITLRKFKPFMMDFLSSSLCFAAIFLDGQLLDYYLTANKEPYLLVLVMGLAVFITIYGIYQLVEMYSRILDSLTKKNS